MNELSDIKHMYMCDTYDKKMINLNIQMVIKHSCVK